MGRNGVLGCLPCLCFPSTQEEVPSSDNVDASPSAPLQDIAASSACTVQQVPSCRLVPLPQQRVYPHHAVGIDDQVNCVIRHLEWENETNVAVAVILHGLGGTGKTTLANAVVARLDIQGWNCFTVDPREVPVRNFADVQQEIQDMFGKE